MSLEFKSVRVSNDTYLLLERFKEDLGIFSFDEAVSKLLEEHREGKKWQ